MSEDQDPAVIDGIDYRTLGRGLAIEAEHRGLVSRCRWAENRWECPDDHGLGEEDMDAVRYLKAVRDLGDAARMLVERSGAMDEAIRAADEARSSYRMVERRFRRAMSRSEFVGPLPDEPLAVGGSIIQWDGDRNEYAVLKSRTIPDALPSAGAVASD